MSESTVVEETKKITKNGAIRQAIEELGMEADPDVIWARAQEIGHCVIKTKQPIYQMKTTMRSEGAKTPVAAKKPKAARVEKITKVIKTRKPAASKSVSPMNELVQKIQAVRECVAIVGDKKLLIELLEALS